MSENYSYGTVAAPTNPIRVLLVKILNSGGGGGSGFVLQGAGAPTNAPSNTNSPALYTDTNTGVIYTWNVSTQSWA